MLLKQRGFSFWREREIAQILALLGTHPDFLVETARLVRFFLELKSFEQETLLDRELFVLMDGIDAEGANRRVDPRNLDTTTLVESNGA